MQTTELRHACLSHLMESDANIKAESVMALAKSWQDNALALDESIAIDTPLNIPGRPPKPDLVPSKQVKHRAMHTVEGRATLIHALAHIEFNAINLALDAVWRFSEMPAQFYSDWVKVAGEEAYHFSMLRDHLQIMGFEYGSFPAHNGLWEMAEKTKADVLDRVALVPRTLEARGLDVTPGIKRKLVQAGDHKAGEILDIILRDEIGHVGIGNHWYHWLCQQRDLPELETFETIRLRHDAPKMRPPFNLEAREAAGFTQSELAYLTQA